MIFHFILKLRQKVAFTGWFERFQNRGVGISSHQSLLFLPSRLHLAVMETKRRRYRWDRIAGAGITLATALVLFVAWIAPASVQSADGLVHPRTEVGNELNELATTGDSAQFHARIKARGDLTLFLQQKSSQLAEEPYTQLIDKRHGIYPSSFYVKDKSEMKSGKRRGKLVAVTDGRGYHIAPLSHSHAVLLPEVASLLEDMGQAFADQLDGTLSEGTTFRVTSLTRTAQQQASWVAKITMPLPMLRLTATAHHLTLHTPIGPATKRIVLLLPGLYSGC